MEYRDALEKASSITYHHQWLNWRAMGRTQATVLLAMMFLIFDIAVNNHPNSWAWGLLISLAIGLLFTGGCALLDWGENRHMSGIFGRIRLAASRLPPERAKKEGKLH